MAGGKTKRKLPNREREREGQRGAMMRKISPPPSYPIPPPNTTLNPTNGIHFLHPNPSNYTTSSTNHNHNHYSFAEDPFSPPFDSFARFLTQLSPCQPLRFSLSLQSDHFEVPIPIQTYFYGYIFILC